MTVRATRRVSTLPPVSSSVLVDGDGCSEGAIPIKISRSRSQALLPSMASSNSRQAPIRHRGVLVDRRQRTSTKDLHGRKLSGGSDCQGSYLPGKEGKTCNTVLFLDVDGVLHPTYCRFPRQQFNKACLGLLRDVIQTTGAEIVLSTAWRLDEEARCILADKLKEHGIPVFVGRTANIDQFHRAREILAWVRKHQPTNWVAVDDWPLAEESSEMAGHFVHTRPRYGLQQDTASKIVELFRDQGALVDGSLQG